MRQCNGDIWQRPLFAFFTQPNSAVPLWIATIASTQLNATHHHPSQMQLSKRWHISCLSVFSHACPCVPTFLDLLVPWARMTPIIRIAYSSCCYYYYYYYYYYLVCGGLARPSYVPDKNIFKPNWSFQSCIGLAKVGFHAFMSRGCVGAQVEKVE